MRLVTPDHFVFKQIGWQLSLIVESVCIQIEHEVILVYRCLFYACVWFIIFSTYQFLCLFCFYGNAQWVVTVSLWQSSFWWQLSTHTRIFNHLLCEKITPHLPSLCQIKRRLSIRGGVGALFLWHPHLKTKKKFYALESQRYIPNDNLFVTH